jgi:hypothetical protein
LLEHELYRHSFAGREQREPTPAVIIRRFRACCLTRIALNPKCLSQARFVLREISCLPALVCAIKGAQFSSST